MILWLGTQGDETAPDARGRLLGLTTFEQTEAYAEDLIPHDEPTSSNLYDNSGKLRWRYAVPVLQAWEFDRPLPKVRDVIGRQLTMAATTSFDELDDGEVTAVLRLPMTELSIPRGRSHVRSERLGEGRSVHLDLSFPGQPGPPPSEWSALTARQDGPTATYLMRFGDRDVWKIGISNNPRQRLVALNFSVPFEILGERWQTVLTHKWSNGAKAYAMEQAILSEFPTHVNERVQCSQEKIESLWKRYIMGALL